MALLVALGACSPAAVAPPPRAPRAHARRSTARRRPPPASTSVAVTTTPAAPAPAHPERPGATAVDAPPETTDHAAVVAVRDALERAARCVPSGEVARVEGGVDASSGRVVLARPPEGTPVAEACVSDALGEVRLGAPLAVRVDFAASVSAPASSRAVRADADGLRAAAATRGDAVRACYERELAHDRTLAGHVEVHVAVDAGGGVSRRLVVAPARFGAFGRCLVGALDALSLPPPTGGAAEVTLPLAFSPGDEERVEE